MAGRDFKGAVNRVTDIVENPCDSPWWVYVKTLLPAVGSTLYMLIIPQPDEILEEYLDPSKTRGRAKRGFQGTWRRITTGGGGPGRGRRGGFPDPDGLVADRLPGRELFASRRISALEHVFWTGLNTVDRVLWYWLLYDAALNFVYEWHSGIFESSCNEPLAGARLRSTRPSFAINQNGQPLDPTSWRRDYVSGSQVVSPDHADLTVPMNVTCIWTQTFAAEPDEGPYYVEIKLIFRLASGGTVEFVDAGVVPKNGTIDLQLNPVVDNVIAIVPHHTEPLRSIGIGFGDFSYLGTIV